MKSTKNILNLSTALLIFTALFAWSCNDDYEDGPMLTGNEMTYDLGPVSDHGISGDVTFAEMNNGEISIEISLNGTTSGMHPAHIHMNTAAETGGIVVSLTPVDGMTGMSTTIVSATDAGSDISYEDLLDFDGYINVHASSSDLATLLAQGDIGQNDLTGESKQYMLGTRDVEGISGTATFRERVNGEALAILNLTGTPDGGMHPAHIHMNTAAEGGDIAFTFNPVNGTTGMSATNVAMLDDGSTLGYNDILGIDGYINVHLSADDLATIVAQGDIGQNELTGNSETYMLNARDIRNVMGEVTFSERMNGETLVSIMLSGIDFAGDHPSHIHVGSAAEGPGAIAVTLTSVDAMGMSRTNVTMTDEMDMVSYEDLIAYDGYINVHLSASELAVLVAQGDIGANAN